MGRDSKYDILFEPIKIGPKTMKNRFYQAPHSTSFGNDFPGTIANYRRTRAEGGWAVINTGFCSIHPEFDPAPFICEKIWDDRDIRNLSLMTSQVHEHDALAGCELYYGGPMGSNFDSRLVARGVNQIPSESAWFHSCWEMDKDDIRELQGFYVAAAKRARSAGFDIINIAGGEVDSIPLYFLMPFHNRRTDEYGGSLENRARFWLETIERVKEAVGDDCSIAVRFGIDQLDKRGWGGVRADEEGVGFIELADHLVDLWDLMVGGYYAHGGGFAPWGTDTASSRFFEENWQSDWTRQVRSATTKPVVNVGWLTNPDTMVSMINSNQCDIIGAARASIADPFLPTKIEEGRLDEIRECIGCNICISRTLFGTRLICTQNATVGEEYRRGWHPEKFSPAKNNKKDVLIVGAGPAGLECARVLGERGMNRIHLVDSQTEMGGAMQWIRRLPRLGHWGRLVDYRQQKITKLKNIEFIPKTIMAADDVKEYGAEIVVVATGSHWAGNGINGPTHNIIKGADHTLPHCLTPEQIMLEDKPLPGEHVLIYDTDSYFMGPALAEKLAVEGKQVTIVTPFSAIGAYTYNTEEGAEVAHQLEDLGVSMVLGQLVGEIGEGVVRGERFDRAGYPIEWETDAVVLVTQRNSNMELYKQLKAMEEELNEEEVEAVYRIGSCVVPGLIADSIFSGHRLAREIDTSDPGSAKPYIREHRILGMSDSDYDSWLDSYH